MPMTTLKEIIGLAILIILLVCFKTNNEFVIKGHIDGIENGTWVKLYDIDHHKYLDSAISRNGDFVLRGKIDHPTSCWIMYKGECAMIKLEDSEQTFNSSMKKNALSWHYSRW
jgi:hypothetical protein